MFKKKLALIMTVLMVVLSFTACGGNSAVSSSSDEGSSTEGGKTIDGLTLVRNVNARKAISMAYDKSFICDEILANGSFVADYFVPKNFNFDSKGEDFRTKYDGFNHFNVEEARKYWAKAKEDLDFDSAKLEFLVFDSESSKKIAEYIQAQLTDALPGLSVQIVQQPFKNKIDLANNGKFQMEFAIWGPDYVDPTTFLGMWHSEDGNNDIGYKNDKYDEILKSSLVGELALNPDERFEKLQEAEKMLIEEDAALSPLYQKVISVVQKPYIKDIYANPVGSDYTFKYMDSQEVDGEKLFRYYDASDIPTLDTSKATDQVSFMRLGNMMEGLYYPKGEELVPGVAKDHTISADGKTYTFNLRKDAKWSNGDSVTAHDFVYSWRRLANPDTGAQYAQMVEVAGLKNAKAVMLGDKPVEELGVKAIDDYTLEVNLEVPVPYFKELVSYFQVFCPINEKFVNQVGEEKFGTGPEYIVCNGPFKMTEWKIGYGDTLVKNENYWDKGSVNVDKITFRVIKDNNAVVNMYESGELDRIGLASQNVEKYLDDPNYQKISRFGVAYLRFNVGNDKSR